MCFHMCVYIYTNAGSSSNVQGWMKYFSLLIFFNSRASALVTFVSSSLLGVLSGMELLPKTVWWLILGQLVALVVLFFWQHLRDVFSRERLFVDSLCIPQHDEGLKSQCIYGLASFLKRSDTLLVLWSPRYCTRLWCMYELGCFLMKQKRAKHILFLPVQMSVLWLLCYLQVAAIFVTALIGQRVGNVFDWQEITGTLSLAAVILIQVLVLYPAYFYIMNSILDLLYDLLGDVLYFHICSYIFIYVHLFSYLFIYIAEFNVWILDLIVKTTLFLKDEYVDRQSKACLRI